MIMLAQIAMAQLTAAIDSMTTLTRYMTSSGIAKLT